jgi:polyisoprenoid-binding protein YceI
MHRKFSLAAVAALVALMVIAPSTAATWNIDSAHSAAQFSVKHLMISTVRGEFSKVSGTVEWDGKNVAGIKVDATIDASTVDTREPKRDAHIKTPDFLDVEKNPTITFKSKKAVPAGPGKFSLVGDLTIRGVTKEVTLDVEGPTAEVKDPWGNLKVGAHATTKINRKDFGVNWNAALDNGGVVVSDEVAISIDLEIGRKPEAAAEKPAAPAPPAAPKK